MGTAQPAGVTPSTGRRGVALFTLHYMTYH